MSPKKDSGRIMDMLERKGYVKRVGDEEDISSAEASLDMDLEHDDGMSEATRRFFEDTPVPKPTPVPVPQSAPQSVPQPVAAYPAPAEYVQPATGSATAMNAYRTAAQPSPADELDRYMDVSEIYRKIGMPLSGVDTIYLIEEYISTLPDSLPPEMRRSIVLKIVAASGFDFDRMLNDGIDRVTRLSEYSTRFAARTDELVTERNAKIEELNRQIAQINEQISERKNLHKRQFLSLEGEGQRLKEVLDFITK